MHQLNNCTFVMLTGHQSLINMWNGVAIVRLFKSILNNNPTHEAFNFRKYLTAASFCELALHNKLSNSR